MKKVVIIGSSGAGKSTLARKIGELLNLEVFHLDRYFWQPGWREKPAELRRLILQRLIRNNQQWIIEGSYLDTSDIRLNAADTIIFLDMPALVCFGRVLNRYLKYHIELRPDLPEGCPEKLRLHYLIKILGFPLVKREGLYSWLSEFGLEKRVYALHSKREVEGFLRTLAQRQTLEEYELENARIVSTNTVGFGVGF
jgi:adenylate kinase family enzyme